MTNEEIEIEILTMLNTNAVPFNEVISILESVATQYSKAIKERMQ